jgi:hypothetical protein
LPQVANGLLQLANGLPQFANGLPQFANELLQFANGLLQFANGLLQFANELPQFANELLSMVDSAGWSGCWADCRVLKETRTTNELARSRPWGFGALIFSGSTLLWFGHLSYRCSNQSCQVR